MNKTFQVLGVLSATVLSLAASGCRTDIVVAPGEPGYCHREPVNVCHTYRDNYGRLRQECGTEYRDHCDATEGAFGASFGRLDIGTTYGMSYASADLLINGMVAAKTKGDFTGLNQLGFNEKDFDNLGDAKLPSEVTMDRIAKNLDVTPKHVRVILRRIINRTPDGRGYENSKRPLRRPGSDESAPAVNENSKRPDMPVMSDSDADSDGTVYLAPNQSTKGRRN